MEKYELTMEEMNSIAKSSGMTLDEFIAQQPADIINVAGAKDAIRYLWNRS